jgi:hypothetical protein
MTGVGFDDLFIHSNSFQILSLVQKLHISKGKQLVASQNNSSMEHVPFSHHLRLSLSDHMMLEQYNPVVSSVSHRSLKNHIQYQFCRFVMHNNLQC